MLGMLERQPSLCCDATMLHKQHGYMYKGLLIWLHTSHAGLFLDSQKLKVLLRLEPGTLKLVPQGLKLSTSGEALLLGFVC